MQRKRGGPLNRKELAALLFETAEGRAQLHGRRFGPGADTDIRSFASRGADAIISRTAAPTITDPLVADAARNFERLVDEMVASVTELKDYAERNPGVIGEQTLARALSRLCPLFPIC